MAWNTTVIIIAQHIDSKERALELGKQFFEQDSKRFNLETFYVINVQDSYSIFYCYQRSKHLPSWIIESHSKKNPKLHFTLVGTALQFDCGPGGVIRIKNGEITDSYGITPDDSKRKVMMNDISENYKWIYEWYIWDGIEMQLRNDLMGKVPLGSCNNDYCKKMIYIPEPKVLEEYNILKSKESILEWTKQKSFQLYPTFSEYNEYLKQHPLNTQVMAEENLIPYIVHSPITKEIEDAVIALVPDAYVTELNPYTVYARNFNLKVLGNYFYPDNLKTVEDLDNKLKEHKDAIVISGLGFLNSNIAKAVYRGIAISWFISIMKKLPSE